MSQKKLLWLVAFKRVFECLHLEVEKNWQFILFQNSWYHLIASFISFNFATMLGCKTPLKVYASGVLAYFKGRDESTRTTSLQNIVHFIFSPFHNFLKWKSVKGPQSLLLSRKLLQKMSNNGWTLDKYKILSYFQLQIIQKAELQ